VLVAEAGRAKAKAGYPLLILRLSSALSTNRETERERERSDDRRRKRGSKMKSGTARGAERRGPGFWRHSSLYINTTGSHHVPSPLPSTLPLPPAPSARRYKVEYFFPPSIPRFLPSPANAGARLVALSHVATRNEVYRAFATSSSLAALLCTRVPSASLSSPSWKFR